MTYNDNDYKSLIEELEVGIEKLDNISYIYNRVDRINMCLSNAGYELNAASKYRN